MKKFKVGDRVIVTIDGATTPWVATVLGPDPSGGFDYRVGDPAEYARTEHRLFGLANESEMEPDFKRKAFV